MNMMDIWSELIPWKNGEIISDMIYEQYDLVAGKGGRDSAYTGQQQ